MKRGVFFRLLITIWFASFGIFSFLNADLESILCRITERARESKSTAVLITHCGRPILEYRSGPFWEPVDTMSITKSIVALAIGILIDEKKLDSVDVPVYHFYPEWNQGYKKGITIRHLLDQTSGIQYDENDKINLVQNIVNFALCAELSAVPGDELLDNNKAINLLSGIVKKASCMSLSHYLKAKLFTPLGIENVSWLSDPQGNDYACAHLIMTAPDLVKIGELLENGGCYKGNRLISSAWINFILKPHQCVNPFYGVLWWLNYYNIGCYWDDPLLEQYECAGIQPAFIQRLRSLEGCVVNLEVHSTTPWGCNYFGQEVFDILGSKENVELFWKQANENHLPFARWHIGGVRSFAAKGFKGQQLVVFPGMKIVAVRQKNSCGTNENEGDSFPDFEALVEELAYRIGCGA